MNKKPKLTSRQSLLISYLLGSPSVEAACKKAKVGRASYYNWIKDDLFIKELRGRREIIVNESFNQLKSASTKAVEVLINLMDSEQEGIRRLASKDVIEYILRAREIEDIDKRLQEIEKVLSQ